ncbi:hypothetical protein ABZ543_29775 [Streptomyces roseifaciens]
MEDTVMRRQSHPLPPARTARPDHSGDEMLDRAVHAADRALSGACLSAGELDAVICISARDSSPRRGQILWQSARIARALDTRQDVTAFDAPSARAALSLASALRAEESVRHVLLIDDETAHEEPVAVLLSA